MKRCPTCNRTFNDPNLSFCIDDGTPLVAVADTSTQSSRPDSGALAYQPPSNYIPPGGGERRRVWPWVLGILGVFFIAIVGLSIAAALFLPRMMRNSSNREAATNTNAAPTTNGNTNLNSNTRVANTNSGVTNSNTPAVGLAPTDADDVLAQLTQLEHEWTVANINADKKQLDRILAEDYVGTSSEGKTQGKVDYIRTIERDTSIQKWDFQNLKLSLRGDRATLSGVVRLTVQGRGDVSFNFTDKFVWRDGRWQATGSAVTPIQQ
ncbi:MAG: nuclear transport factor 2 family protein [Pyrinomonadaceae bacterium]